MISYELSEEEDTYNEPSRIKSLQSKLAEAYSQISSLKAELEELHIADEFTQ